MLASLMVKSVIVEMRQRARILISEKSDCNRYRRIACVTISLSDAHQAHSVSIGAFRYEICITSIVDFEKSRFYIKQS